MKFVLDNLGILGFHSVSVYNSSSVILEEKTVSFTCNIPDSSNNRIQSMQDEWTRLVYPWHWIGIA